MKTPAMIRGLLSQATLETREQRRQLFLLRERARTLSRRAASITKGQAPPEEGEDPSAMLSEAASLRTQAGYIRERLLESTFHRRRLTLAAAFLKGRRYYECEVALRKEHRLSHVDFRGINSLIQQYLGSDQSYDLLRMWARHELSRHEIQENLEHLLRVEELEKEVSKAGLALETAILKVQDCKRNIDSVARERTRLHLWQQKNQKVLHTALEEERQKRAHLTMLKRELEHLQR